MNVIEIREALCEKLAEIDSNLTVYGPVPHQPNSLPCLIVYPPDQIDYRKTRNLDVAVFPVIALVGPQDPKSQELLEALMSGEGTLSILAKLYEDRQLAGTTSNLRMLDVTSGAYTINVGASDNVIGCEFRVEVTA